MMNFKDTEKETVEDEAADEYDYMNEEFVQEDDFEYEDEEYDYCD